MFASCNSSYNARYTENEQSFSNETYIVKTKKGFDSSKFASVGAFYDGTSPTTNLLLDGQYYTVRRSVNTEEKKIYKNVGRFAWCVLCLP